MRRTISWPRLSRVFVLAATRTPQRNRPRRGRLIRVPEDVATPRLAIEAAQPGDVILLADGTYDGGLVVPKDKPDITIRGASRSGVLFDGKGLNLNAIEVQADRVTLENLSAHDFDGNGFYWEQVEGFAGRYLTVWNVNLYGIYATESRGGTLRAQPRLGRGRRGVLCRRVRAVRHDRPRCRGPAVGDRVLGDEHRSRVWSSSPRAGIGTGRASSRTRSTSRRCRRPRASRTSTATPSATAGRCRCRPTRRSRATSGSGSGSSAATRT